jgi:hypothetical protein
MPSHRKDDQYSPGHAIVQLGELVCPYCTLTYSRRDTMLRHIRLIHGTTSASIDCVLCSYRNNRKDNMVRHYHDRHKQRAPWETTPKKNGKARRASPSHQSSGRTPPRSATPKGRPAQAVRLLVRLLAPPRRACDQRLRSGNVLTRRGGVSLQK